MAPQPAASSGNLMALPDGHELVGDYRIKRVLGAGGFGITYLADEPALARLVTIKEYFPADYAARDGAAEACPRSRECEPDYKWGLDRFIEEAQTLAKFTHPNIVQVYRYFRANSTGYMVLKFEEGGSFKAWLRSLNRAPRQAELDAILTPLLDALELVHKGNFLHRDIAPDNIIIRKDGAPVLIDFGSARGAIAAHSKTVSALVKPGYSPYEQYATDARQQGPWTDIYALGGTLYHAITGKRPLDAPTRMVADEFVAAKDAALSSYRPGFLDAIDRALRLDIKERPQTIADWRSMLLAPPPKRGAGNGAGGRLRGALAVKDAAAKDNDKQPVPKKAKAAEKAASVVPPPPDAPTQQKGQLLDFIEGLRKHRPEPPKPVRKLADAVRQAEPSDAPKPDAKPPAPLAPAPQPAARAAMEPAQPRPQGPFNRRLSQIFRKAPSAAPKPRRMPSFGMTGKRWRSIAAKLLIGVGIASAAVYFQDPPPQVQGRGQATVTSQATDLAQLGQLVGHKGAVSALTTFDMGRSLASTGADGTLRIWSAPSSSLLRTIELDDGSATALAASALERRVITGHRSGGVVLWDTEKAEKVAQFQHGELPVTSLAFLSDGQRFAATNAGGAIAVFDTRNPAAAPLMLEAPDGTAQTGLMLAAARQRATIAFAGADRSVKLWQLDAVRGRAEAGRPVRSWRPNDAAVTALDTASHGWSAVSGMADGSVRLWSTSNARGPRTQKLHDGKVTAVAFGPGDRMIATTGEDGAVRLWDTWTGTPPRTFKINAGPLKTVAFSADGRRLYVGAQDGPIRIWSTTSALIAGN